MKMVVQKWGNSLGIRIPSVYVKKFDLTNGNSVEVTEEDGKIIGWPAPGVQGRRTDAFNTFEEAVAQKMARALELGDGTEGKRTLAGNTT